MVISISHTYYHKQGMCHSKNRQHRMSFAYPRTTNHSQGHTCNMQSNHSRNRMCCWESQRGPAQGVMNMARLKNNHLIIYVLTVIKYVHLINLQNYTDFISLKCTSDDNTHPSPWFRYMIKIFKVVNIKTRQARTLVPRGTNRSASAIVAFKLALYMQRSTLYSPALTAH